MSAFEFILVLVSVVAGFAVSEILSGWGRLIRERTPISEVGVYLLASSWLLLMITRYIWVLWLFREIEWRFLDFMLTFMPILVLALAAYLTNPVRASNFVPATHYLSQARPFCYLVACYFLTWSFGIQRAFIAEDEIIAAPQIVGLISAVMFIGLAHVRKQIIHGFGLALALLVIVRISTIAAINLGAAPSLK